jgi:hypothetical protein
MHEQIHQDWADHPALRRTSGSGAVFPHLPCKVPPVNGFWSLTLYDSLHMFHPNALHRYSLGTKNRTLRYNADGSLTLYADAKSPGKDKESNWLPAPNGTFSLYIRAYWADKAILDRTWQPPAIAQMK